MKRKRKIVGRAAASMLIAAMMATPALADTIGGATVHTNDTGLNLRTEATTASPALAMVPNGAFLLVEEALDGWYKVVYNGTVGYVSADYAIFAESLEGTYDFSAATLGTDVNLRSAATTASGVVKRLAESGSALTVTGVSGNWLRVQDEDGSAGYIRSDLVDYRQDRVSSISASTTSVSAETAVAAVTATVGEQIAASAAQYIGYRYVWGGTTPERGFDCSGFVNYIYGLYGYSLERVAQSIYSKNGASVSRDALQPGDLMCFGYGPYSVTHIGIYVGDNQMIHASNSRVGVIQTDLSDSSYYNRMFVGAKRIIS